MYTCSCEAIWLSRWLTWGFGRYNNQGLQLFTSSLFIAGMAGGLIGGFTTRQALFPFSLIMSHASAGNE